MEGKEETAARGGPRGAWKAESRGDGEDFDKRSLSSKRISPRPISRAADRRCSQGGREPARENLRNTEKTRPSSKKGVILKKTR